MKEMDKDFMSRVGNLEYQVRSNRSAMKSVQDDVSDAKNQMTDIKRTLTEQVSLMKEMKEVMAFGKRSATRRFV